MKVNHATIDMEGMLINLRDYGNELFVIDKYIGMLGGDEVYEITSRASGVSRIALFKDMSFVINTEDEEPDCDNCDYQDECEVSAIDEAIEAVQQWLSGEIPTDEPEPEPEPEETDSVLATAKAYDAFLKGGDEEFMSCFEEQQNGHHYLSQNIQPIDYIFANELNFAEGCILKYLTRYPHKGGADDLKKIIHYTRMILEDEYRVMSRIDYSE